MTASERLAAIADVIEGVERRCLAADGPVTPTTQEITEDELRQIWTLTQGRLRAGERP